jgi:hypothetical protein
MIELAPVQLFVFGFENAELFTPAIIQEVERLQSLGLIRLIDLLYVERTRDGDLVTHEMSGLSEEEAENFGQLLTTLLGMDADDESGAAAEIERSLQIDGDAEIFFGLTTEDMAGIIDGIRPGGAAAMVLWEHTWALDLKKKIRSASGYPIAQGYLTPEVLLLVGEEIRMTHDAAEAIELAKKMRGAALLDALEAIAVAATDTEPVKDPGKVVQSAALEQLETATSTVRALIEAGFIRPAAAEAAIKTLVENELIGSESMAVAESRINGHNGRPHS